MDSKKLLGLGLACALSMLPQAMAEDAKASAVAQGDPSVTEYFAGENCCEKAVPVEVPFEEGKTPPRPCKGYFWTLITKPATFKCVTEQVKVSDATFYMKPVPAKYEWVEEQIMVAPARKLPTCCPAKFNTEMRKVVVQEAHTQMVVVPAEFEDVCEEIIFRPEMEKEISVPAQYKTEMMTIQVEPERDSMCGMNTPKDLRVQCGEGVAGSIGATHTPARCITIPVQKEISPATTKKIKVPAIKKTIMVRKLKKPASVQEVKIPEVVKEIPVETCVGEECIKYVDVPAEYKCVRRLEMKEPAKTERVEIPAKYQTFKKNEICEPVKMVWRQYSIGKCKRVADTCARYGCLPGSGAFDCNRCQK